MRSGQTTHHDKIVQKQSEPPEKPAAPQFRLFLVRRMPPQPDQLVYAHGFGIIDACAVFTELAIEPMDDGNWKIVAFQRRAFREWVDIEELADTSTVVN